MRYYNTDCNFILRWKAKETKTSSSEPQVFLFESPCHPFYVFIIAKLTHSIAETTTKSSDYWEDTFMRKSNFT